MSITKLVLLVILALSLQNNHERLSSVMRQQRERKEYEELRNKPREELDTDELELVQKIEKQDQEWNDYVKKREKQLNETP